MKILNKKGFFFTLTTYLLLSFFVLVFFSGASPDFDEAVAADRIGDISNSIISSIREIVFFYYDLSANISKGNETVNVTLSETISSDQEEWGKEFSDMISKFKTFVESEDPDVKLNASLILEKELPVTIMPYNITYSRDWSIGHVVIDISKEGLIADGYEIIIDTGATEIDKTLSNLKSGDFLFRVVAMDDYGNVFVEEERVNSEQLQSVSIFLLGGNKIDVTLQKGVVETWTNSPQKIDVTSKIVGLPQTNEKIGVALFKGAVTISIPLLNAERVASISLVEA